jgi:hypothetical protein
LETERDFGELRQRVDHAMEDVLADTAFRSSAQLQSFLRYVVEHSFSGEDNLLRERVIGAAVFGRSPDYDTSNDPVVRIRAAELRKRLALVYQNPAFQKHVRLHMPVGSYRVQMEWSGGPLGIQETPAKVAAKSQDDHSSAPSRGNGLWKWTTAALVVVLAVVTILFWSRDRVSKSFWAPFAKSGSTTLVISGSNAVYRFSDEIMDRYAAAHNLQSQGMEFFMDLPADGTLSARDLHASRTSFVALGDVRAVALLVARLTQNGAAFENRFPNDISFSELRKSPAILVGGFNNPLTMELTKNLRFVMVDRHHIIDRLDSKRSWSLYRSKDAHDNTEDYAILTRLVGGEGQAPLLVVAGMGQYGTVGATEFALSPSMLNELNRVAISGWQKHNLQVVLHLNVTDFKNARPEIMAVHSW